MNFKQYIEEVKTDGMEWLRVENNFLNYPVNDFSSAMTDMLNSDEVGGCWNECYVSSREEAIENCKDLIFDKDFKEAMEDLGYCDLNEIFTTPEETDVRARQGALGFAYSDLEDYFAELWSHYDN